MSARLNFEQIEVNLLLAGIRERYGYDFTHYARDSLVRRLTNARDSAGVERFTELLDLVFHDVAAFDRLLAHLSITVTDFFRDPIFFRRLREQVIPALKTYPFVKIWLAGCATGEEAYSIAMMLEEENFLDRARIYATDFNKQALGVAERGVYPATSLKTAQENYVAAGGKGHLADYYSAGYDLIKFKDALKKRITFSYHNLVSDGVFGEMNLILCRNVMIYFDRSLQARVLDLFDESLRHGGFLCLGTKETLYTTALQKQFSAVDGRQKIYRKMTEEKIHAIAGS